MYDLNNKTALITGASRGIGHAIALTYAKAGAKVIIHFNKQSQPAQELQEKIVANGGKAVTMKADLNYQSQIESLFAQIKQEHGKIDILVNNAGVMKPQGPLEMDWQTTLETFTVDIIAPMFCSREAMKLMLETYTSGTIINIASVRGLEHAGLGGNLAYSAAKAGLINFTCSLAKEWDIKKQKIRVNCIAPGYTNTDLTTWNQETISKKAAETALGKIIDPQEIANTALFLASDAASAITGEILVVDAGLRLK